MYTVRGMNVALFSLAETLKVLASPHCVHCKNCHRHARSGHDPKQREQ